MVKPTIQGRPLTSSTITVSKAPTYHLQRGTATLTSIQGAKNSISQIRAPTPPGPSLQQFVRTTMTPSTTSPTTTVSQSRARVVQTVNNTNSTIANIYGKKL